MSHADTCDDSDQEEVESAFAELDTLERQAERLTEQRTRAEEQFQKSFSSSEAVEHLRNFREGLQATAFLKHRELCNQLVSFGRRWRKTRRKSA